MSESDAKVTVLEKFKQNIANPRNTKWRYNRDLKFKIN